MKNLFICVTISFLFEIAWSQESFLHPYVSSITREELSEHVHQLASEAFEGRYTGSEGQRLAAQYIQDEFGKDGLGSPFQSISDPYLQKFTLDKCYWTEQVVSSGDSNFIGSQHFVFLSDPEILEDTFQFVFAGYGIDDSAYSDYENLDVNGKVVIVYSGVPKDKGGKDLKSGKSQTTTTTSYHYKSEVAAEKGAAGLIIIAQNDDDFDQYARNYIEKISNPTTFFQESKDPKNIFCVYVSSGTGAFILKMSPNTLETILKENKLVRKFSGELSGSLYIRSNKLCFPLATENVIGTVEGTDLKDEAVVIIAHYDHLGSRDGEIFYGADDNASGTAALMEVAEAFVKAAQDGHRPRRTVIFIAATAEEIGLYGSRFYSENPIIPLEKTFACINIDMIGRASNKRKENPGYISGYAYLSVELLQVSHANNSLFAPELSDHMEFRPVPRGGSDHYYFAINGIPSLFYFAGIHEDYHDPGDTPDKILYDRMETTVRAIFGAAWDLANREEGLIIKN